MTPGAPIRVLIVEDSDADAELVTLALDDAPERFVSRRASSLSMAMQMASSERFDVIVSDLSLPDARGLEAVEMLRRRAPDVPLVVLTGDCDLQVGVAALKKGAQECVVKGWSEPATLISRILEAIRRGHALDQLSGVQSTLGESRSRLEALRPGNK